MIRPDVERRLYQQVAVGEVLDGWINTLAGVDTDDPTVMRTDHDALLARAEVVRRAVQLYALVNGLGRGQTLMVRDEETKEMLQVHIPWLYDSSAYYYMPKIEQ